MQRIRHLQRFLGVLLPDSHPTLSSSSPNRWALSGFVTLGDTSTLAVRDVRTSRSREVKGLPA